MKDVFKKIEDMLKEELDSYNDVYRIYEKGGDKQLAYVIHEKIKEIRYIRKMIGEIEKEYNDGWIPVDSGKLPVGEGYEYYDPEEDMTYYKQVLVHTDEVDIPYCVAYYDTDTWFCAVTGTPLVVDRWKLIEPYQPKGEK